MHLIAKAPAKVNLCLLVGPGRSDGYHELFSVFAPLDMHDELLFTLEVGDQGGAPGALDVSCPALDDDSLCGPNLVERALRALEGITGRAIEGEVQIGKAIPIGAGLGGGSSDAAVALKAGARLLAEEGGIVLDEVALHHIARGLGADVPFFLGHGPALGRGIGDLLEPVSLPVIPLVVLLPEEVLGTAEVYKTYDGLVEAQDLETFSSRAAGAQEAWRGLASEWSGHDMAEAALSEVVEYIAARLENDLELASFNLLPHLAERKQDLLDAGAAGALMSGSGPTVFGLCRSLEEAQAVCRALQALGCSARCAVTVTGASA